MPLVVYAHAVLQSLSHAVPSQISVIESVSRSQLIRCVRHYAFASALAFTHPLMARRCTHGAKMSVVRGKLRMVHPELIGMITTSAERLCMREAMVCVRYTPGSAGTWAPSANN